MPAQAAEPSPAAMSAPRAPKTAVVIGGWAIPAVVGLATLVGLIIRLLNFDQSLIADELSTYWIVHGRSLGKVVSLVHSDAEITPPFYFALGWFTSKLGSDPMWLRLPSLIAGTASIPLMYVLGAKTIGRVGGAIAAVLVALSPFMIYYSEEARAYSVMIFLLIVSTIALVNACEARGARWWVLYAVCICLAMLSHYTAIFYLIAQFLWAAWAHPTARKGLLLASAGAVVGFMPWITGFIADNNSPTTAILNALQPFNFGAVRFATEQWAAGYPYVPLQDAPGHLAGILLIVGALMALAGVGYRAWKARGERPRRLGEAIGRLPKGLVLVVLLALATPVGEALASAVSTNLYGARNLDASWPGLALVIGAAIAAAGPIAGPIAAVAVLIGFSIGASKTLEDKFARTQYRAAARYIEDNSAPRDVVIDGANLTPVPTTGLDVFLPQTHPEYRLDLPVSDMPFTIFDRVPSPVGLTDKAFTKGKDTDKRVIVLRFLPTGAVAQRVRATLDPDDRKVLDIIHHPPYGYRLVKRKVFPGIPYLAALVYERRP